MKFIKNWLENRKREKETERLMQQSMYLSAAGMVNNPDICIKGLSTFACVCGDCMDSYFKDL